MSVLISSLTIGLPALSPNGPSDLYASADVGGIPAIDDGGGADPLRCTERMAIPAIDNALEAVWSPTGTHVAFTQIIASNSLRTVTGYEEDPGVGILEVTTGRIVTHGEGKMPRWSASGQYLSFWRQGRLFVIHAGRNVAILEAGMPEVRWVGDQLLYFSGREIRAWTLAGEVTLSVLPREYWPIFPRDWAAFSADGRLFTLTRYSMDGRADRFVGETRNGHVAPLDAPGATYTEWAPSGQTLLVRSNEHVELRGPDGWQASAPISAFAGAVHGWTGDGKGLLMGRVSSTVPAGTAFDRFQLWNGVPVANATLPNLIGSRTFSPDGKYFSGIARTGLYETTLEVYRCGSRTDAEASRADPVARSRQARIDADLRRFVRPVAGYFAQFVQGVHTGVDIAAPYGSLITTAEEGEVTFVGWRPVGGRAVCVQHDRGVESCYYHTSYSLVRVGQRVARGEPIVGIGMTGLTTGPHVHWEVKAGGRTVDPLSR